MAHHPTTVNLDETFDFTASAKKKIFLTIGLGALLLVLGIVFSMLGGHHGHEEAAASAHAAGEHHEKATWIVRLIKNLWHNNIFFAGISVMGVFFVAFNYVAWAGWSSSIIRVPAAFGNYLWVAAPLAIITFLLFGHDLFHWTHEGLYIEGSEEYDHVLAHKRGFLNTPFFLIRMVVYFALWLTFFVIIRRYMQNEDITGEEKWWHKLVIISAGFLVIFGVTSSTSAWDWIMSVDPHWFSTMFGWYCFASWFVSALAIITFIVVVLKENGYLAIVNENHLHDLGKFIFAFSIFWTYVWFEQFLLYYYSNLPEEIGYFVTRLKSDAYTPLFFLVLILNFFAPFLILMTRNAKRQTLILKIICCVVVVGHWLDFYMMFTPPILKQEGGLDGITLFMELGMGLIFVGIFSYMVLTALSKLALIPKNHPMIQESVHHHVF
ncbi:MAG: quinol:cytochrome C oxidoreductase [Cytophagaceae bacterium]